MTMETPCDSWKFRHHGGEAVRKLCVLEGVKPWVSPTIEDWSLIYGHQMIGINRGPKQSNIGLPYFRKILIDLIWFWYRCFCRATSHCLLVIIPCFFVGDLPLLVNTDQHGYGLICWNPAPVVENNWCLCEPHLRNMGFWRPILIREENALGKSSTKRPIHSFSLTCG